MRGRKFLKADKAEVAARLRESLSRELTNREAEGARLSAEILPYINRWFSEWDLESGAGHYGYNLR